MIRMLKFTLLIFISFDCQLYLLVLQGHTLYLIDTIAKCLFSSIIKDNSLLYCLLHLLSQRIIFFILRAQPHFHSILLNTLPDKHTNYGDSVV
jgi:hypothetical protein